MNKKRYILPIVLICTLVFMSSCNNITDDTTQQTPDPEPEPPVEEVEQRLISMIKDSRDDFAITYYFGYDDLDRIDRVYRGEDEYWELFEIDYVSDDFIKVKLYLEYNEPSCYLEDEFYLFLNENGYVESNEGFGGEYTYNNNGYLIKSEYNTQYYSATYDIRWRNGNIFSIVEKAEWGNRNYFIQSNTKNLNMVNIDLSKFMIDHHCGLMYYYSFPLDIWGTPSNNYITSFNSSNEDSNEYDSIHYNWAYDNDGYPRLCRVTFSEDETDFSNWLYEISYIDETGELEP